MAEDKKSLLKLGPAIGATIGGLLGLSKARRLGLSKARHLAKLLGPSRKSTAQHVVDNALSGAGVGLLPGVFHTAGKELSKKRLARKRKKKLLKQYRRISR